MAASLRFVDTTTFPEGATKLRYEIHLITEDDEIPVIEVNVDEDRQQVELTVLDTFRVPTIYL